jgi:uncharacterized protein YsxB (DUF464 family)
VIKEYLYETADGDVCGFKVTKHGDGIVCAAVSMLCINAVNSLETLTDCRLEYCYEPDGGYIECLLPGILSGEREPEAGLLLRSLAIGLGAVKEVYGLELVTERKSGNSKLAARKKSTTFKR